MRQLRLPLDYDNSHLIRTSFSHGDVSLQTERQAIEERYGRYLEPTDEFNRRLVSYQGNKGEILHSWIKYREGFSAQLVERLIQMLGIQSGDVILDPFSGSATTLLVAKVLGLDALGIELLPVCHLAWEAKSHVFEYDLEEISSIIDRIVEMDPGRAVSQFPHLVITESAFGAGTENDLMFFMEWVARLDVSPATHTLLRLALTSILEEVSFTRKDGQYLRWDRRSEKVRSRNAARLERGQSPIKGMHKGTLPSVKEALLAALGTIVEDIEVLQQKPLRQGCQRLIKGSSLEVLPTLEGDQFAGVITSPPYCNRYDYTRTYALELAFLGIGEKDIRQLRQNQLSCTVEHRSKEKYLAEVYQRLQQEKRYRQIMDVIHSNAALREINHALQRRWERGEINNRGILPMVAGYFTELTFVFAEILRTSRPGAHVAFVNDNVRYGGEVIPVDLLTTDLAVQLGFEVVKVFVLPQQKGNSSQQMKRFGREPLRKSITIWRAT